MTKPGILTFAFLILIASCNDNKSSDKKTTKAGKDSLNQKETVIENEPGTDVEKKKTELAALTPVATEQLEKMAPAELSGASRTEITTNSNLGTPMVMATYLLENSADLRLTILDCGGPGGAGIYGTLYADLLHHDSQEGDEYTKTIDFNGGKAIEHGNTRNDDCSITWFTGNRWLVSLEGKDKEIIKQAAKGLTFK